MSMLAEIKTKKKWSLNPRGNDWAKDTNKFGQKMLERMGWKEGKGLGAKENGITKHIRTAYKNDIKGFGFKESSEWSNQQDNFAALLAELNSANTTERKTENSLERKSEGSRARVHYRKYVRGKDLSRYSKKDLANILGRSELAKNDSEHSGAVINLAFESPTVNKQVMLETIDEGEESLVENESQMLPIEDASQKEDYTVTKRKRSKVKKRSIKGVENPCFDEEDSLESSQPVRIKKRKRSKVPDGIDNPAFAENDKTPEISEKQRRKEMRAERRKEKKRNKETNDLQEGDLILNVTDEPVDENVQRKKRSKINSVIESSSTSKRGFDNATFDFKTHAIEESITSLNKILDDCQAEVENGINESKTNNLERAIGESVDLVRNNEPHPNGLILRFRNAKFDDRFPHWQKKSDSTAIYPKKSYKHLIKGDIVLGFKNSNLHEIGGYGTTARKVTAV